MKLPKTLYRYTPHHELEKIKTPLGCTVASIRTEPYGTLYRMRNMFVDFYGWDSLKAAREEERMSLKRDIAELQIKLKKLEAK